MTVCKGCEERRVGCHSECERYIAEKAKHDALRAEYNRQRDIDNGIQKWRSDNVQKALKYRRDPKWR